MSLLARTVAGVLVALHWPSGCVTGYGGPGRCPEVVLLWDVLIICCFFWAQLAASLILFFNVNYFKKVFLNKMKDGSTCKSPPT